MELDERIELYKGRLSRESFILAEEYEGNRYDVVAEKSVDEAKAFGESELTRTLMLISKVPENTGAEYVQSEIDRIPMSALSGFRSISRDKTTFFIRVFLMDRIPFEIIQRTRDFDFSRSEQGAFNYIVHAGVVLVDNSSNMVYSNKTCAQFCSIFKVVTPVEIIGDEDSL
ncbi:hypothetical protein [Treponema sp.]|uniref:hypothetical protein n=1 Tax=Treponema sp. TaxID=166 RepID=UPI00388E47F5